MLQNTFCHIAGVGEKTEQELWNHGVLSWEDVLSTEALCCFEKLRLTLPTKVKESVERLDQQDANFFSRLLPASQQWRLFKEFRHSVVYIDIETTGLTTSQDLITTISMYDGNSLMWYVQGDNLQQFKEAIADYRVLVTYNGRCFDVPMIRQYFNLKMDQAHIDLRFVLAKLGFKGGLKGCERQLGIERGDLDGLDGYDAVLLWNEFKRQGNWDALETLLAYNVQDALNLEYLMVMAYNLLIRSTPFYESHQIALPTPVKNPFRIHRGVVDKIIGLRRFEDSRLWR